MELEWFSLGYERVVQGEGPRSELVQQLFNFEYHHYWSHNCCCQWHMKDLDMRVDSHADILGHEYTARPWGQSGPTKAGCFRLRVGPLDMSYSLTP